jgi:DNA topoisomerase IB
MSDKDKQLDKIKKLKILEKKNKIKYCNLVHFGNSVDQILDDCVFILNEQKKEKIAELTGLDLLALSILLMDECNFRVGNLKYKNSTGLLTIETKHCDAKKGKIEFLGKKQVVNSCLLDDKFLTDQIRQLWNEVDTYSPRTDGRKFLFSFDNGKHRVNTNDLNNFLKIYHPSFSAKMFRTWKANSFFLEKLKTQPIPEKKGEFNENLKTSIEYAAEKLYHTPGICKKSYIDNRIIQLYKEDPKMFDNNVELVDLLKQFCE